MKLTHSAQAKGSEFFRDMEKGKLINKKSPDIDRTKDIIENLPNTISFVGRMLLNPKAPKINDNNKLKKFVNELVSNENNVDKLSDFLPQLNKDEKIEDVIDNSLSYYGKNLKYDKNGLTLKELIINNYSGKKIDIELKLLHNFIKTLIDFKIDKLSKSISENIIPFIVENNKLKPQTGKMKFLFSLLKNDRVDKSIFEEFNNKYAYSKLEKEIIEYIDKISNEGNTISCKKIYDIVLEYNHNFYKNNETNINIEAYVFFLNEIRNHFRTCFPVKDKNKTKSKRLNNLNEKNAKYYCSDKFVCTQVWRHIVNQLVQGLIMYGKLQHYYYSNESKWQIDKINSNGLSEIQIEESFKKQMFLSLCWGATRLNYFFNFGSQNINQFNNSDNKKNDRDIFIDKTRRYDFYKKIMDDNNKHDFEDLIEKMATWYPLDLEDLEDKKSINKKEICFLLEVIVQSCYKIRNNVFHYNKTDLCELFKENLTEEELKKISDELELSKDTENISHGLLQKDIYNIQNQFIEQIKSSGITNFYSLDTLTKVFKANNLCFYLYSPQYPMMPSFKNVFTRGINISNSNSSEKKTLWFIDKNTLNNDAYLVYKNLLQLIYYNSFLPAIRSDEKIITKYINETKEWNKNNAISKQKGKKNIYKYRYNDMPNYNNINLSDYLSNLQHLQSIKENDEDNAEKDNYYTDFVKDIFVLAFNSYLQNKIPGMCEKIKAPCKQDGATGKILEDLLDNADVSLKMKTEYEELNDFIGMYMFLKLLDQRELNRLLHQFIRYRTSTKNNFIELQQVEELIALVQFTLPPPSADENYKKNMEQYFSKFIENNYKEDYVELYFEEDKKTEILRRSISLIGRTGAMALYTDAFTKRKNLYKVTKSDYKKYLNYNLINGDISIIEEKQNEMQTLHKDIVTATKYIHDHIIEEKINKYKELVKEIKEYNNVCQKVKFDTLYKLHQCHIDILGRFASFAEDWERDMFFMLTALKSLGMLGEKFNVNNIFEDGNVVGDLCKALKTQNASKKLFCNLCWADGSVNEKDYDKKIRVRNILAHLNHMTQCNEHGAQPSIIEIVNKLRVLLAYDLKRQNSVTKSIQDLLLKDYKIKLSLEPEKTNEEPKIFKIKSLITDNIVHLKNISIGNSKKSISIKANDDFFINLIRELLTFKYEARM